MTRDDATHVYFEEYHQILWDTLQDLKQKVEKQPWSKIKFPRLKKIWTDYMKLGFVRDDYGLEQIEELITTNLIKIHVNTDLSGHSECFPVDEVKDEFDMTMDEFWEFLAEDNERGWDYFMDDQRGEMRISDYGLEPMLKLLLKVKTSSTAETKLPYLDQILNVVHMRSDIAEWFVEGGSYALSELSGTQDVNILETA